MNHVMIHAPEFRRLADWVSGPILPTPAAVGNALQRWAVERQQNILACDIGGATTDVFSVIDGTLYRTVSANLGMSYSVNNVLAQAGLEEVQSWVPFPLDGDELQDLLANKMIRPTSLPETVSDLLIEQVMARCAIRLSLEQHKQLISELRGVHIRRCIGDIFRQTSGGSKINLLEVDAIIGSGSVLSLAPRRQQAALILLDAFLPQGVTDLYLDSQFLLPHVGALVDQHPSVADDILHRLSIIHLGVTIAPVGNISSRHANLGKVEIHRYGQSEQSFYIQPRELMRVPLPDQPCELVVHPAPGFNVGAGVNRPVRRQVQGGLLGLIVDGRGRPLSLPRPDCERHRLLIDSYRAMAAFSEDVLEDYARRGGAGDA
jgi:hypothetical protein